jgi:hypothetical protein
MDTNVFDLSDFCLESPGKTRKPSYCYNILASHVNLLYPRLLEAINLSVNIVYKFIEQLEQCSTMEERRHNISVVLRNVMIHRKI